ncbi:MAG: helix-turn-helix transcriptional regulator, partial [Pseudomonadota bacterium]
MPIPPDAIIRERFDRSGADLHSFQVSARRDVLVYDASYPEHEGLVHKFPALVAMLCISGGGPIWMRTDMQDISGVIEPGSIGVAAPSSPGSGHWPEMRMIGIVIEVSAIASSTGRALVRNLKPEVISKLFHDPIVESTMMQVGYTYAGQISDSVLRHAAQLVLHQLLDQPADPERDDERSGVHPLATQTVDAVREFITDRIEQTISVDDLAQHVAISRHHFSRRFSAATGKSPYQFILDVKLDHAATSIKSDPQIKIIDIANMVGYRNPAQFAKAFRRRFGQSPRSWR